MGTDGDYVARCATYTRLFIGGSVLADSTDKAWALALRGLFGEPMSELFKIGMYISGGIYIGDLLNVCNRTQPLQVQSTTYYMAFVELKLPVNKTCARMRHHPILAVSSRMRFLKGS